MERKGKRGGRKIMASMEEVRVGRCENMCAEYSRSMLLHWDRDAQCCDECDVMEGPRG